MYDDSLRKGAVVMKIFLTILICMFLATPIYAQQDKTFIAEQALSCEAKLRQYLKDAGVSLDAPKTVADLDSLTIDELIFRRDTCHLLATARFCEECP